MPWREVSVMDQRREFVRLAMQEGANRRELCRRFNIHPDTGYKWLARWQADQNVDDRSRRPHASPGQTDCELEARILAVRDAHPAWGARKIAHCLERNGLRSPAVSTVHQILRRSGRIKPPIGGPTASQRFEMPAPNLLWQMDFKGWVRLGNDTQCHPLTVVDDHSRYDLCLQACADQRTDTVRSRLEKTFRHYGLPELSSSTMVRPGVILPASDGHGSRCGCSSLASPSSIAAHITRKAAARMNDSTAPSRLRCSHCDSSAISQRRSVPSTPGGKSTTSNGHTRRSDNRSRPVDIGPASDQCPIDCHRSNTTAMRSCAASPRPKPMSASRDVFGKCHRPSVASASPSAPRQTMRNTGSSLPPTKSLSSTWRAENVSAMSPNTRRSCPRAEHQAGR